MGAEKHRGKHWCVVDPADRFKTASKGSGVMVLCTTSPSEKERQRRSEPLALRSWPSLF